MVTSYIPENKTLGLIHFLKNKKDLIMRPYNYYATSTSKPIPLHRNKGAKKCNTSEKKKKQKTHAVNIKGECGLTSDTTYSYCKR